MAVKIHNGGKKQEKNALAERKKKIDKWRGLLGVYIRPTQFRRHLRWAYIYAQHS